MKDIQEDKVKELTRNEYLVIDVVSLCILGVWFVLFSLSPKLVMMYLIFVASLTMFFFVRESRKLNEDER